MLPESKSTVLEVGVRGSKAKLLSVILQFELSGGWLKNVSTFEFFNRHSFLSNFPFEHFLFCTRFYKNVNNLTAHSENNALSALKNISSHNKPLNQVRFYEHHPPMTHNWRKQFGKHFYYLCTVLLQRENF